MSVRRERWRRLLEGEIKRWSEKSCDALLAELVEEQCYEVEFEGRRHQVEVQILENKPNYAHVLVSVDDGSLPASILPLCKSFVKPKIGVEQSKSVVET